MMCAESKGALNISPVGCTLGFNAHCRISDMFLEAATHLTTCLLSSLGPGASQTGGSKTCGVSLSRITRLCMNRAIGTETSTTASPESM